MPIKEVKNLRGRVNFHNATKIIAKITYRENNVLLETSGIGVHKHFKHTMEDAETSKYIIKKAESCDIVFLFKYTFDIHRPSSIRFS